MAGCLQDFRKEVDPWCGHKPETLVCNGTHIGVSLRQMNFTNPVTSPDPTLPDLDVSCTEEFQGIKFFI